MDHNFKVGDRIIGTEDNKYAYTNTTDVSVVMEINNGFYVSVERDIYDYLNKANRYPVDPKLFKLVTPAEVKTIKTKSWTLK